MGSSDPDPRPEDEAPNGDEQHNELRYRNVDEEADHDESPGDQGEEAGDS